MVVEMTSFNHRFCGGVRLSIRTRVYFVLTLSEKLTLLFQCYLVVFIKLKFRSNAANIVDIIRFQMNLMRKVLIQNTNLIARVLIQSRCWFKVLIQSMCSLKVLIQEIKKEYFQSINSLMNLLYLSIGTYTPLIPHNKIVGNASGLGVD